MSHAQLSCVPPAAFSASGSSYTSWNCAAFVFIGRSMAQAKPYSEQTAALIDQEVKSLLEICCTGSWVDKAWLTTAWPASW